MCNRLTDCCGVYMKLSSLKQASRSELRHRILSSLNLEPASSVTSLANKLGVLRPSVSRAVKSLQDAGFVTRTGRNLVLSRAGQEELRRLDDALSAKVKKNTDLVVRLLEQPIYDARKQLVDSFLTSAVADSLIKGSGLSAIAGLINSPAAELAKSFSNSSLMQAVESFHNSALMNSAFVSAVEAVKATALVQTANLGLVQSLHLETLSPINHLILENNLVLGNMLSDLGAITEVGSIVDSAMESLISQTAGVAKAFDAYFMDMVSGISQIATLDSLKLSVSLPTVAAASLVGTTRSIVESEILVPRETTISRLEETNFQASLRRYPAATPKVEVYLQPLGQYFVNIWEGAWQTLHSGNKDRHRQATHSGRELLMQVLAYLAPDNVFTKEDYARYNVDKPTRKMRIKYILGGDCHSKVELINGMANTLDSMHDVLVGEAHRRDSEIRLDDTIAGQLGALGNLLIMLLSMRSNTLT